MRPMTDLLERAIATARRLSPDRQDDIARIVLTLAADEELVARFYQFGNNCDSPAS
jgi:hypothetical protein